MKLTFLGAAGEVTGSQHLLEADGFRMLFDCGLLQGPRKKTRKRNENFACKPRTLDCVVLSHAHTDHAGLLPRLVAQGFKGPIFCTPATLEIIRMMLMDSARIQEEDAAYLAKKLGKEANLATPLFTQDDVHQTLKQVEPVDYRDEQEIFSGVKLRFSDAGHILGSAISEITVREGGGPKRTEKRVVFTGDLGRRGMPLLCDPEPVDAADVVISECLYAGRVHPPPADLKTALGKLMKKIQQTDGRLILPAFSLGRTQQVLYYLNELWNEGELAPIPVFVDSPLATRLTNIFRDQTDIMDDEVQETLRFDDDAFDFPTLHYVRKRDGSIALNHREGAFAVISASGMCEHGRIVHHLKHAISDDRNVVGLLGYQAPGTTGRRIQDLDPEVKIFNRPQPLKADVEQLSGLSAHADLHDLKWWFERMAETGAIHKLFMVHGEPDMARDLKSLVGDLIEEEPVAPHLGQSFEV